MQRSDDGWEPGPVSEYIGQWISYWWSRLPRPPEHKAALPLDEGDFIYNGKTKKWEKKEPSEDGSRG